MKIYTYTIYCKVCKCNQTYDIDFDSKFDHIITGLGHIFLNCHSCNDYSIYIGDRYCKKAGERFRYDAYRTKKNLSMPVYYAFGVRYDVGEDEIIYNNRGQVV